MLVFRLCQGSEYARSSYMFDSLLKIGYKRARVLDMVQYVSITSEYA